MALSVTNTAMAVTIDTDKTEPAQLHSGNKQDVGQRLALAALGMVYGKNIIYSGPIYESMSIEGNKIRLKFKHGGDGLMVKDADSPKGFTIAGEDRQFVWAEAKIDGDSILVLNEKVSKPVAVRYAWAENPIANLYNKSDLPASPFRTDDWPGITVNAK